MGLRINTNVASLNAQRNLRSTTNRLQQVFEKLSSGNRINRSGDDAAGLAISNHLRAQIRGLDQATRNAEDGISLIQVAEGGLTESGNILVRLRELAIQAASDTVGVTERAFLNVEYNQLLDELDRISLATEFNSNPLINGQGGVFDLQVGTRNNPLVDRISFDARGMDARTQALGIAKTNVKEKPAAQEALAHIDEGITRISKMRADLGAIQNRLMSTITNQSIAMENLAAANSRILDADIAKVTSELTREQILSQSGTAVLTQANAANKMALQLLQQ